MNGVLPPAAVEDLYRYISYGWLPGIIMNLLNRTYGLTLTVVEVRHMIKDIKRTGQFSG